jgi:hypothetical protein
VVPSPFDATVPNARQPATAELLIELHPKPLTRRTVGDPPVRGRLGTA